MSAEPSEQDQPRTGLLEVANLRVHFPGRGLRAPAIRVIEDVSFTIGPGETLSLVGESGSGKTTIGRAILGLAPITDGTIRFRGQEIGAVSRRRRQQLARGIQTIFQDPYSSLNPSMTIEDILVEPLQARGIRDGKATVGRLLEDVHLPAGSGHRLAREFSGGQRQRIAIARALALDPELIVCDEPTSALDMTTQSTVLNLLTEIQQRSAVAYLFISHDLAVVHRMSDRIGVLLQGQIVELGTADDVMYAPQHPYTKRLQMATPLPDPEAQARRRAERLAFLADTDIGADQSDADSAPSDAGRPVPKGS